MKSCDSGQDSWMAEPAQADHDGVQPGLVVMVLEPVPAALVESFEKLHWLCPVDRDTCVGL